MTVMARVSSKAITFVCVIIVIVIGGSRGRAQALQLHNASEDLVPQPRTATRNSEHFRYEERQSAVLLALR